MDAGAAAVDAQLRTADRDRPTGRDIVERREHPRARIDGAAELLLGPLRFPCAVVDVSSGGAQLVLSERIAPLSPATLRIVNVGALHCRVVWSKGDRTGVRFLHEPNWVKARIGPLLKAP
jgi:hypothetical protein